MSESYGDLVSAALRADAEAARAEIRAEGIACPSCNTNMADLPDGHMLAIPQDEPYVAQCSHGTPVTLAASSPMSDGEYATWQAVANISVWDAFRQREAEAFKAIIGEGPANFTGLLSILNAGEPPSA